MIDARTFTNDLDSARKILLDSGATFKGEYLIHDIIYKLKDGSQDIGSLFLRLRIVPKNIWGEKPYIVAIKKTELKQVGKESIIPIKEQFDTEQAARDFVAEKYTETFELDYEFDQIGWQYDLGEDQVDLEDIEGHGSIEFKSKTEEGLKVLIEKFNATNPIVGPSVVAVKKLLNR